MKNLTKTILVVLAAGLVSGALSTQEAQAAKINGTIDFAGATQFDSKSLANATRVVKWRDVNGNLGFSNVADVTGNFSSIALGTKATMATSWIFSPSPPTPGLWSVGGFTFNLLSSTVVTQTSTFLNITGTGILSGNGFDQLRAHGLLRPRTLAVSIRFSVFPQTQLVSLMVAQQFLCSVALCLAWLPCGES